MDVETTQTPQSYDEMLKPALQVLCTERKLPTSGTKDELVARLRKADREQSDPVPSADDDVVLTALDDDAPEDEDEVTQAGPAPDAGNSGAATPDEPSGVDGETGTAGAPVRDRGTFRAEFKVHGELSDGIHQDYRRQTADRATAAGHRVVQGTAGARLLGIEHRADGDYAIYQVHVRQG